MNLEILKTITVLYVEDETQIREEMILNISPFVKKVIVAGDGKEGLELFKNYKNEINLIISDILMPYMNGIDMIDKIRDIDPYIPVIYTTAFSDSNYMKKTIDQSIVAYIVKPIDIEKLLNAIEKASLQIENERFKHSLIVTNQDLQKLIDEKTKELQEQNKKLYYQLYTDGLTSLPNRRALIRDLKKCYSPVVLIVDIDRFKNINDLYGEKVGNKVLILFANILKNFIIDKDCSVYRIGSDQFVLLKNKVLNKIECEENILFFIKKIERASLEIEQYDLNIKINITVGISNEKKNIIGTADMALKKAKSERKSYLIYKPEYNLGKEFENDIKWTRTIESAIENDRIKVFYQGIADRGGNIKKYEALVRIVQFDKVYTPIYFLELSKKVKFYDKIETVVIKKAFEQAKMLGIEVSVNISIEDIINKEFVDFIENKLNELGIAHLITFEFLESESITDYDKVSTFIDRVKNLGCKVAIDDFGSGYSNFIYLVNFKPDYLKIDGSLIKNIDTDKNSYLIVKTINSFSHALGIKTVAEFVSKKEIFDILLEIGIDLFQGYYVDKPKEL